MKEFHLFIMDSMVKLYPDVADLLPYKRVLIIVDSGPGQKDLLLLAKLKVRGFYLHAGVPNTTHVMQPTDQNYRLFKSMYHCNLETLVPFWRAKKDNASRQTNFLFLVFRNCITSTEQVVLESAYDKQAFSVANSKATRAKMELHHLQDDAYQIVVKLCTS